jgi:protocatechuate 4,5-dioxygenase, beta chain
MANLVGSFAFSHAPSIGRNNRDSSPQWRAVFDGFDELQRRLLALEPDTLVVVYDDHLDNFFLDCLPTYAIGCAASYGVADEGYGRKDLPPVRGHEALSWHLATSLIEAGFDLTVCQELLFDHGVLVPLPLVGGRDKRIVPIVVNTVQPPMPTARRCWQLGRALGEALRAYPGDERIVVCGTGGLAHQLGGRKMSWIATDFDRQFLRYLTAGPRSKVAEYSSEEIMSAGNGTNEIRNWIIAAGTFPEADGDLILYEAFGLTGVGMIQLSSPTGLGRGVAESKTAQTAAGG